MGSSGNTPGNHIDTHLMLPYTYSLYKQRICYGKFKKKEGAGEIYL